MRRRNPIGRALGERSRDHDLQRATGPLVRFLRSRAGRRWSAVHSELCRSLPPGKIGDQLRELVCDFVTTDVERRAGVPGVFDRGGRCPLYSWPSRGWGVKFYADPTDGTLREAPPPPPEPAVPEPITRIDRGDGLLYLKDNGIWYAAQLRPVPRGRPPLDQWLRAAADAKSADRRRALYGRGRHYAVCKRQLDRRTLRRAGLENDR